MMTDKSLPKLKDIVSVIKQSASLFTDQQDPHTDRLSIIINSVLPSIRGNIIEIGAGFGVGTQKLAAIAERHDVNVTVIDPFESGWDEMPESYGKPYPFEKFKQNLKPFLESRTVSVIQENSNHPELYHQLEKNKPYVAAFVDGLQYADHLLGDINLMAQLDVTIICLDDMNRLTNFSQTPLAVVNFLENNNDYQVVYNNQREIYLVKKTI